MQSRTDQVHSYQFFLQRVVSGLVARESDPAELPFRRLGWSAFGSIMVAVLVAAGVGIYGFYVGGGATSWQDGSSIVVEKGSETPYLYRDQRLYPMVNFVSAQLALGAGAEVTRVSARSLAGVPRGPTLGIPGAPEGLPGRDQQLTGGWTLCSQQRPDGHGGQETISVLGVGRDPDGGQPAGEQAVLVRDATGDQLHLVWHGHRYPLVAVEPALHALGASPQRAVPVAPAWLDALPVGDPLEPPAASDPGAPTDALGEVRDDHQVRTGQVIVSTAGTHYLVRSEDLREITPLQAELVLADPATAEAYPDRAPEPLRDVPPGVLANALVDPLPERTATSPPETRPQVVALAAEAARDAAVCAAFAVGEFTPVVWPGARLSWVDAVGTPSTTPGGAVLADHVLVTGGRVALVETLASPDAPAGAWQVVTDQGIRYPLPAPEVASVLDLDPVRRVRVPAGLLARLPAGPALDPVAAVLPVPGPAA